MVTEDDFRFPACHAIAAHLLDSTGARYAFTVKRLAHCTVTKKLLVHLQLNSTFQGEGAGTGEGKANVSNNDTAEAADEEGKTASAALAALPAPDPTALLNVHPRGEIVTGVSLVVAGSTKSSERNSDDNR